MFDVFLAESEGFVPERAESVRLSNYEASGVVTGRLGTPPHLVKGVTYNDLELRHAVSSSTCSRRRLI